MSVRSDLKSLRFLRPLLNPGLYIGVVLTLALVVAAYQVRPTYSIQIGTATDGNILEGFNTPEVLSGTLPLRFRWTTGDALITLQDIGRQDYDVTLNISGYRPQGVPPAQLKIEAGDRVIADFAPSVDFTDYKYTIPREAASDGTLGIRLLTNEFEPPGDPNPRPLGVMITHVTVAPSTAGGIDRFIEPSLGFLGSIAATSALLGLLLAALGWGIGTVALGGALPGLLGAWLLVTDRFWLTGGVWYSSWPGVVFAGGILIALAYWVGGWALRLGGVAWTTMERRVLLTAMLAAFVIRLAGQFHPLIFIPDAGFHAHRFEIVESGTLLFTAPSSEWGKRANFYLPTAYIFMLPLQWLLRDELLVVKLFTAAIGTLGCLPLFYIAVRLLRDGRAGLMASALYLSFPIAVLAFSWGITTNLFGEFVALCALAVALGMYGTLRPSHPSFYVLLALLFVAVLSHPGVVLLVGLAFVGIFVPLAIWRRSRPGGRGAGWALVALALASVAAYLVYYTNFAGYMLQTFAELSAERAAQATPQEFHVLVGGSVVDRSLGLQGTYATNWVEWLMAGPVWFWKEARAYYNVWPFIGALFGVFAVRRSPGNVARTVDGTSTSRAIDRPQPTVGRPLLVWGFVGWMLAVSAFALMGWVTNLFVRYMLFALPVLALGVGILLSRLWARSRIGAILAILLIALFVVQALALWDYRISYAFKG